MLVVVPARNEEELIGRCLDGIAAAEADLRIRYPSVSCVTLVVLDRCTDRTVDVVRAAGVPAVSTGIGSVGAARALGADLLLAGNSDLDATWIACTDADSVVPGRWLSRQVAAAADGADLLLGTVLPIGLSFDVERAWHLAHDLTDGHCHVHGANLGVRASWYRRVGGFAALPVGEDVMLAREVRAQGGAVVATAGNPVATSCRRIGRAPAGFSEYLRTLDLVAQDSAEQEPVA